MSAQIFLTEDEILTLLLSELPHGVYPEDFADAEDPNDNSVSSAELRAHARVLADLYANLEAINDDKNLTTVTEDGLTPWEKELFSTAQDSAQPYGIRQQNLISKYRSNDGISLPAIYSIAAGILGPAGLAFDLLPYSGQATVSAAGTGAWVLGVSELGVGTWLSALDPINGKKVGYIDLDCSQNYSAAGLTQAQMQSIQATAYTYEIRIYGTADAATLALLDTRLTEKEPARSTHIITNGASDSPVDVAAYETATPYFARLRPQES